ncbi:MAG TPA: CCA tRNA nucleotidyltransferase [Clostridiales bacterium]|nr:CCA tRNA nucleotidyltransferase [Clostridiales bacterium]
MKIDINIPREVETALNILIGSGFEAYIVGGCVRDSLLGTAPNDWDITTSAQPDEIKDCFQNYRTINTGLKHGTLTVLISAMPIEITTYRIDGRYSDNRRPDSVLFTDNLFHDLKRRDFTINALAYNDGGIVDLFGGIKDIENKLIKCVGDPHERFNEDGLRILRALRFASVLNFRIEDNTSASVHENRKLLHNISKERISGEFNKLITGGNFYEIMKEYRDVIRVFIPETGNYNEETWINTLNSMSYADDLVLRLALLLHETGDAEKILRNLKYDGSTIRNVKILVLHKDEEILPDKIKIKKQLNKIGYDNYVKLLKFKSAVFRMRENEHELVNIVCAEKILNDIDMTNECYSLDTLKINGKDLIMEGFSKGVFIGSVLNEILSLVIEEKLENDRKVLIDYAKHKKILN